MSITPKSQIRDVHGISQIEKERIYNFLQGAVYCWCKNKPAEWFSMRDLMGGENYDWQGTPLFALYLKQHSAGVPDPAAIEQSGKESGWLLKRVIEDDSRVFDTRKEDLIRQYRWTGPVHTTNLTGQSPVGGKREPAI